MCVSHARTTWVLFVHDQLNLSQILFTLDGILCGRTASIPTYNKTVQKEIKLPIDPKSTVKDMSEPPRYVRVGTICMRAYGGYS